MQREWFLSQGPLGSYVQLSSISTNFLIKVYKLIAMHTKGSLEKGHVCEGLGVGFRVRSFVRVSLKGLSMFELWPCPFFIGDPVNILALEG